MSTEFIADLDNADEDPTEVLEEYGFTEAGSSYVHPNGSHVNFFGADDHTSLAHGELYSTKEDQNNMGRRTRDEIVDRLNGSKVDESSGNADPLEEYSKEKKLISEHY